MPRASSFNSKPATRGSSDRDNKLRNLIKNRKPTEPVDWSSVDGARLADFASAVGNEGGAVTLGYTRGAGAYRVGVYLADEREDMYFTDVELMYQWMKAFMEDLGAL
jgi:hypothetical protein